MTMLGASFNHKGSCTDILCDNVGYAYFVLHCDNVVYVIVLDHYHCDDFCGNVCVCLPMYYMFTKHFLNQNEFN